MGNKKKILILFEGQHLAFSPTIKQLYDHLAKENSVTILAQTSERFIKEKLSGCDVIYYKVIRRKPTFIFKTYYFLLALFDAEVSLLRKNGIKFHEYYYRFRLTKKIIQQGGFDRIIATDLKNLFYCTLFNKTADFISLELGPGENLLQLINTKLINCVIIQSKERLAYLFPQQRLKTFYIQNAPVYKEIRIPPVKKGLLFGGTAWEPFGFYYCLNYLREYTAETLTIQGAVPLADRKRISRAYKDLLDEQRLIINESYIDNDEVVNYFTRFELGICFYNFEIDWINHFNYLTAPSGKVFKYLAAGLPVLAVDIPGFTFINEFECGALVKNLEAKTIREAIVQIRSNYETYSTNAILAAKHFSFDKAVQPYLDFVRTG